MRAMRAFCSGLVIAHDFQRQGDVLLDGAPGIEGRRLEDIAVGAVLARASSGVMPLTVIVPEVGFSRSAMTRRNVVLPQPEGPMKETKSPFVNIEIDAGQRVHRAVGGLEGQTEVPGRDHGCGIGRHTAEYSFWLGCVGTAIRTATCNCGSCEQAACCWFSRRTVLTVAILICRRGSRRYTSPAGRGSDYFDGMSAEDGRRSKGICMHLLTIPPGGRAKAHLHESTRWPIYVLSGEAHHPGTASGSSSMLSFSAGEMFYIPAGVPHLPANLAPTLPAPQ